MFSSQIIWSILPSLPEFTRKPLENPVYKLGLATYCRDLLRFQVSSLWSTLCTMYSPPLRFSLISRLHVLRILYQFPSKFGSCIVRTSCFKLVSRPSLHYDGIIIPKAVATLVPRKVKRRILTVQSCKL